MAIAVGVLSSLVLTGLATYEVADIRDRAYQEARGNLLVFSSALSKQVSDIVKSQRIVVREVARTILDDAGDYTVQDKVKLTRTITGQTGVDNLFLYDLSGKLLIDSSPQRPSSPPFAPSLPLLSSSKGLIFEGRVPSSPSHLAASELILSQDGRYRWLATTWLDFSGFEQTVHAVTAGGGYKVALLADDGRLLMSFPSGATFDMDHLRQEVVDSWGKGVSAVPIHDSSATGEATEKLVGQIDGAPLVLRVSVSDEFIDTGWTRAAWILTSFAAAGLAVIWLLVGVVLRQIRFLMRVADRSERGEAKLIEILSRLRDGVIATDLDGRVLFVNSQAYVQLEASSKFDLIDQQVQSMLPISMRPMFSALIAGPAITDRTFNWEGRFETLRGNGFESEVRAFITGLAGSDAAVITIHDATHQKVHEARLVAAATIDPVTKLPNMLAFRDRLSELLVSTSEHEETCHAVLALQLTLPSGSPLGDSVQPLAADRLLSITRDADSLASDGGGRFYILARDVAEPVDVAGIARRIGAAYEAPITVGGARISMCPRIGIALIPFDGEDEATLLATAQTAAASLDSNSLFRFANDAVSRQLARFHDQADRLAEALRSGHLFLRYNPLVDIKTGTRIGAVAVPHVNLTDRVVHLERLSSIVEEAQISSLADACVLDAVLGDLDKQPGTSVGRLLVPVQRDHFVSWGFVDHIKEILPVDRTYGGLAFFVSELLPAKRSSDAKATVSALSEMGIETYLADVGAGLASLTEIVSLGVAGVIVDRSVIKSSNVEDAAFAFLTALTSATSALGMRVFATGVEDADVERMLANMGIAGATGPLYGKALVLGELASGSARSDGEI
ncbi:EAL domain-containing protein [Cupriavidus sp. TMH.W2]|uniref:EAL domain-containing protein n=1 Tax=Cupriavidus sp. TMH.W2 TaxID=3434465 RepID=UPI003D77B403